MNDAAKQKRLIELTEHWRCMADAARGTADKRAPGEAAKTQAIRLYGTAQGYEQAAIDLDELITAFFGG